jgi:hypothetical protein
MQFNFKLKIIQRKLKPVFMLWAINKFNSPAPQQVKMFTLKRHGIKNANWIETGTYLGDTAKYLARSYPFNTIYTIEPEKNLHKFSINRLKKLNNIKFYNLSSEEVFETILSHCSISINLWLDGHYSGDVTYKGLTISPISHELTVIEKYFPLFTSIVIFVDDFRLFQDDGSADYPSKNFLVSWAIKNNLYWTVENDIFIAKTGTNS